MPRPREKYWYALRIFKDMARAKKDFSNARIPTFIPYRVEETVTGFVKYEEVPLVDSLIFVFTTAKFVKKYAYEHFPGVRYYRDLGTDNPGKIRDEEMEVFMRVTAPLSSDVRYFDQDAPEFHKGDAVLITDGQFKGMQGHILRVGKDRKVIVTIQNVCSLLISNIHPRYLQHLENNKSTDEQ